MASAREVPDSNWHISSSTNSGYREQKWFFGQDFSLSVSSFDVVSKIGFVMFVQYPQWNFLSYWKWPIINFWICHHKTHCIDLRWSFDKKWQKKLHLQHKTPWFKTVLLSWKIFINLGDIISEAFKGRQLFMWSHRKPELRNISDQGFSKMAVIETQMEMRTFMYQLHEPLYI